MTQKEESLEERLKNPGERRMSYSHLFEDSPDKLAMEWYNRAEKSKDLAEQIACYEMAISFDPKCVKFYTRLAIIHEVEDDYDKAIECYKKALGLELDDEEKADIHTDISEVYIEKGEHGKALEHCEKAIEIFPEKKFRYYFYIGVSAYYKEEYGMAIEYLNKSLAADDPKKSANTWTFLSDAYSNKGEHEKAILCRKKACELNPSYHSNATFLLNWGVAYSKAGRNKEAKECYEKSLEITPDEWKLYHNLSIIYERTGEKRLARTFSKRAEQLKKIK